MKVQAIINQTLLKVTPSMHARRRHALGACVMSILQGHSASVTHIGRGIVSDAKEKHTIKRADRLCSNTFLHAESHSIYQAITHHYGLLSHCPIILVDWSDLDDRGEHFLLRAALAMDSRALTLYQEVHPLSTKNKASTHQRFLTRLQSLLPASVRPVIVTDAGFRCTWFQQVLALGWDFVGRVRNKTQYQYSNTTSWYPIKTLYQQATKTPRYLGSATLAKANPTLVNLVVFKKPPKGRHKLTRKGRIAQWSNSKDAAQRQREPWLLASSLRASHFLAKRMVKIYQTRMQIEQTFRDTKSVHYGVGLGIVRTRKTRRLSTLLLLVVIASLLSVLLGLMAEAIGMHRQFQANSVQDRRVISWHYLGLRVVKQSRIEWPTYVWRNIYRLLKPYLCRMDEDNFL